jgi:hypothetical protein
MQKFLETKKFFQKILENLQPPTERKKLKFSSHRRRERHHLISLGGNKKMLVKKIEHSTDVVLFPPIYTSIYTSLHQFFVCMLHLDDEQNCRDAKEGNITCFSQWCSFDVYLS